jgi:Na+-driven multidrug efflux pump
VLVPLSALLIFGFGPIPPFGVPGAAWAFVLYYAGASAVLAVALLSRDGPIALILARFRPDRRHFRAIFGVGAISALMTVQANLIVVIVTGIVGAFGTAALAGYGLAARLDYLLVPLLFGLGSAAVTLIATNIGAGRIERARKIAWTAVAIGAGVTESIGIVVAVAPHLWLGLFSEAPDVLQTGATYLRVVGPFYGCFGAAMILYFCAQGAGSMGWPFAGGIVRLLLATVGGWVAVSYLDAGLTGLSIMISVSYAFFAALNAFTLRRRVSEVPKPANVETGSE